MGINNFFRRLFGAPSAVPAMADNDFELANAVGFDASVMQTIRRFTAAPLCRLETERTVPGPGNTLVTALYRPDALCFESEQPSGPLIVSLRKALAGKGYLVFLSEQNFGHLADEIAILRSSDPFDIVRCKGTDGIGYGIDNETLIATIKTWNAAAPLEVTGAGRDWVELQFTGTGDWRALAEKIQAFCPDAAEPGEVGIAALAAEMRDRGRLYLWWG